MKKIILASGSPRRQQFLKELDIPYEVVLKPVEETYPTHLQREQITDYLAELKATPFEGEIPPNCVLLTSDTLVWHEGKALGKPKDAADAFAMLRSLSGKTHEVITSVCFTTNDAQGTHHCVTKVTFRELTDKEITHYIEKYKPFDKAGAYGIQEWIGHIGVTSIEGSYNNVMGLPTHLICQFVN
ncbi:Maf-like protein [Capnocytophaga leadbetteri]|uniref:Maf-like protein n=1 Tax=Capnocytophaga leadbetteri TaxID=327575 RepID=UPI0026EA5CB2|nr:Maf-like protein [Capnocytophaga leadbetteri]